MIIIEMEDYAPIGFKLKFIHMRIPVCHSIQKSFMICIYKCKDQIWLESKTGMDPGSRSPNNKFVECRRKS